MFPVFFFKTLRLILQGTDPLDAMQEIYQAFYVWESTLDFETSNISCFQMMDANKIHQCLEQQDNTTQFVIAALAHIPKHVLGDIAPFLFQDKKQLPCILKSIIGALTAEMTVTRSMMKNIPQNVSFRISKRNFLRLLSNNNVSSLVLASASAMFPDCFFDALAAKTPDMQKEIIQQQEGKINKVNVKYINQINCFDLISINDIALAFQHTSDDTLFIANLLKFIPRICIIAVIKWLKDDKVNRSTICTRIAQYIRMEQARVQQCNYGFEDLSQRCSKVLFFALMNFDAPNKQTV
jgi:hypothetical protein